MNQTRIERIPGDNTYSNYQEANRTFWRQTVLPLVNRTAKSLSAWLSPAFDATLDLRPDLDAIEALSPEREALWTRLENTTFLTRDEKRAAVGYAPLGDTALSPDPASKFNPHHDDRGRFTFGPNDAQEATSGERPKDATVEVTSPIRLAQVGNSSSMTDSGLPFITVPMGAMLVAPEGGTLQTFTVGPLTNNVYTSPMREPIDVTGWTAYYGAPGSKFGSESGWTTFDAGVLLFLNPNDGSTPLRPTFPGN